MHLLRSLRVLMLLAASAACAVSAAAAEYFAIRVVDEATGRGVPLVQLRTVDNTRYWTDSQGLVAYSAPGQMNQEVFFYVESDGYEFPSDGFGFHGKKLQTVPGEEAELRVKRVNVAERLYRVTGAGIYRDSVLLGRAVPIRHPLLNAQVTGSDSVNTVVFGGAVHWFWGDTNRPAYPLGMFHVPGAVSQLPTAGGLDPSVGVDLQYFTRDDGFVADTAKMPGDGPTWIDGVCVLGDSKSGERLFARYMKVRKFLEVYERGLVEFDAASKRFEKVATYDFAAPLYPHGHALRLAADGEDYVYFGNPYPHTRVRANAEALRDPGQFEAFTCLAPGTTLEQAKIERDADGRALYTWKRNAPTATAREQAKWLASGKLKSGEAILTFRDAENGKAVMAHAGTVAFNAHRRRYVMILEESFGTSNLGEVWYAEADMPLGPWVYARKVVTHKKYSFYNPRHHPMFDADGGRRIFFEGTYATLFSGVEEPTPLYDYNQIMYRLDLDDPRLVLPVAIWERVENGEQRLAALATRGHVAFMAPDRPREGLVPIGSRADSPATLAAGETEAVLFYALPAETGDAPSTTVALYEWRQGDKRRYLVEGAAGPEGFTRAQAPLCRVWRYPIALDLPWK
jgi:hypothetical protein